MPLRFLTLKLLVDHPPCPASLQLRLHRLLPSSHCHAMPPLFESLGCRQTLSSESGLMAERRLLSSFVSCRCRQHCHVSQLFGTAEIPSPTLVIVTRLDYNPKT
ncbi:hypothetical protein I3760_08G162700 [Carya illinoinensis]|nr:hypothetical protein I3760_08G162700 [Carya illinoinensis]KAG2694834.1 hypothetical protein I3760_08G162700 [Carya illinoinensis]